MAGVDPGKFSGLGSGLLRQSEDLNITSQINIDSSAAKAEEERSGEGRARSRGRPKGSRNKSKSPHLLSGIPELKIHAFEIASGVDVTTTLDTFARTRQVGVFILSGSGTVANVTLLELAAPEGTMTYTGPLEIVFLSGMFDPPSRATRITIMARKPGLVLAGEVVGSLIASDRIIVVTGIGAHFTSERLNVNPLELAAPALSAVQQS